MQAVVLTNGAAAVANGHGRHRGTAGRKSHEQYRTLFRESQAIQEKLRQLTHLIITAQEEERKEISRELHDEVVQTLVGINVELTAITQGSFGGVNALRAKIARTQRLVEDSVNAVHRFARDLRPVVLDDLGLIPALHAYIKSLAAAKNLKVQMTASSEVEAIDVAKRIVLYRVAQEALTNVARHARATQVKINLTAAPEGVRLEIRDNGRGFSMKKTLLAPGGRRVGLVSMRERVEMVGGTLTVKSTPRKGTLVSTEIPCTPENPRK